MKKTYRQYAHAHQPSYLSTLIHQKQYLNIVDFLIRDNILRWTYLALSFIYHTLTAHHFQFEGKKRLYSISRYNKTWGCERAVEVPIAIDFVTRGKQILELGNVLSHYIKSSWTIVDKFETAQNTINQDILEYQPTKKFDQIISISTVEHIGKDDSITNPKRGIIAIETMKTLLTTKGEMLITIPVGYNPILDQAFIKRGVFDQVYAMKRTTPWNTWKQVDPKSIIKSTYGWPYNNANAILIGFYRKP